MLHQSVTGDNYLFISDQKVEIRNPQKETIMTTHTLTKYLLTLTAGCLFTAGSAMGATYTWTYSGGGTRNWTDDSNWSGSAPTTVSGDEITMNMAMSAATFLNLEADRTFEKWTATYHGFGSRDFTINSGYTINLAGTTPTIEITSGTLTMANVVSGSAGLKKTGGAALVLNNTGNDFSGGIELAGGTLQFASDAALGDAGNDITVTGSSTLSTLSGVVTVARDVALNNGTTLQYSDKNTFTISGAVTGQGGVRVSAAGFGNQDFNLSNTGNTFTGTLKLGQGDTGVVFTTNSFADSTNNLEMQIGSKGDTKFVWGSGAVAPLVLDDRQVILSGGGDKNHVIENANANTANTITISKDLSITRTSSRSLVLGGVNTGSNTIAGAIPDGAGSVTSLVKNGSGKWVLGGANTYTGNTTIQDGTLEIGGAGQLGNGNYAGNISIGTNNTLTFSSSAAQTLSGTISSSNDGASLNFGGTGIVAITGDASGFTGTITATGPVDFGSAFTFGDIDVSGGFDIGTGTVATLKQAENSTLSLASGTTWNIDIQNGANFDNIESATGSTLELASGAGAITLNINVLGKAGYLETFTIFDGTLSGAAFDPTIFSLPEGWSIDDSGSLVLTYLIPEPSTAILAGLGLMGICFRRRRR